MVSRRVSLSSHIQNELQERILNNVYKKDEYLPSEAVLCEEFGVSRTTVRDAISALVEKGFVKRQQGKGILVTNNTDDVVSKSFRNMMLLGDYTVNEFFETREMIQSQMAYFASKRATKDQLERLNLVLNQMEASADNIELYFHKDMEFHNILAEASGNRILIAVYEAMLPMMEEVVYWVVTNGGPVEGRMKCHSNIYNALISHNSEMAKQESVKHDRISAKMFQDALDNGIKLEEFKFQQIWANK